MFSLVLLLEYFTDKSGTEKVGTFQIIPDATKVHIRANSAGDESRFRFGLTNGEATLEVATATEQERSDWLLMITRVGFRGFGKYDDNNSNNNNNSSCSSSDVHNLSSTPPYGSPVKVHQSPGIIFGSPDGKAGVGEEYDVILLTSEEGKMVSDIHFDNADDDSEGDVVGLNREEVSGSEGVEGISDGNNSLMLMSPGVDDGKTHSTLTKNNDDQVSGNALTNSDQNENENENDDEDEGEDNHALSYLDIRGEVKGLFFKLNLGHSYDHKRLLSLLHSLECTPLYRQKESHARDKWLEEVSVFAAECLATQRGFVPSGIFQASFASLTEEGGGAGGGLGVATPVARRLFMKKSLWLVRMASRDISRLSAEELTGVKTVCFACLVTLPGITCLLLQFFDFPSFTFLLTTLFS